LSECSNTNSTKIILQELRGKIRAETAIEHNVTEQKNAAN